MTIILENVSKSYNNKSALENFNLEVEWGKCYALVGPAGTGKTTALNIFMGTEKPDSGKVSRMGDYKYPTLHSAYVSQDGSQLVGKKDAIWNVRRAHRFSSKTKAISELSKFLDSARLTLPVAELTDVERRFVEIVRASFAIADFVVLDEPFYGMNSDQRKAALEYILDFRGSRPLLLSSQDESDLEFAKIKHMK